ncbi:calmodulin-related [Lithospermum erythrorhizon]|uniref:Calmodulin-related n=1 Tax=Lithospermum erythrorhizon TaxID=34254 RepID=A0AAV3PQ33_LITER
MDKIKENTLKSFFSLRKNKKNNPPITTPTSSLPTLASPISSHTYLVNQPKNIEEELEKVFKKFDVNGDGKICSSELGSIMTSLGNPSSDEEIAKMIKEFDLDGDGHLDLQEFIELNTKDINSEDMLGSLREAFSVFDIDKNGLISVDELHKVLRSIGEDCTLDDCKNMINGYDANGDGFICFEEFKVMMMNGVGSLKKA